VVRTGVPGRRCVAVVVRPQFVRAGIAVQHRSKPDRSLLR